MKKRTDIKDQCEAVVPGHPTWAYEWVRVDHQCPRRANQGREGRLVCWQHAQAKQIHYVERTE
jgi:hypothetical protein